MRSWNVKRIVLAACIALVSGGFAATARAGQEIYKPYYDCMAKCNSEAVACDENVPSKGDEKESRAAECASTKAACIQECQYLPIPGTDGVTAVEKMPQPAEQPQD